MTYKTEVDDFFSTGTCIGEIGVLTGAPRASSVSCETFVMAYHVTQEVMETALGLFSDPSDCLEARIWRAIG